MSTNPRYAKYQQRVNDRKRLKAEHRDCWICRVFGRNPTIDYTLPAGHPLAFEMDELVPISKGGSPTYDNSDATHRCCNQWRGNKSVEEVLAMATGTRHKKPMKLEQPIDF